MRNRWYYAQGLTTYGPLTVEQFKERATHGLIRPDALVWPEGADRDQAIEAAAVLDLLSGTRSGPSPNWLEDVAKAEKVTRMPAAQRSVARPDWFDDVRRAEQG